MVALYSPLRSCCVLISHHCLLPTRTLCFLWPAIKKQPIGTAGRRAPAPGAPAAEPRLPSPATHSPGSQSARTHGGKHPRVAELGAGEGRAQEGEAGLRRGLSRREREREPGRYRERGGEREQANERRGSRAAPLTVILDCTSTGVCGLAGLYTSKQNKERLYSAIKEEREKNKAREKSLRLNYKRTEDSANVFHIQWGHKLGLCTSWRICEAFLVCFFTATESLFGTTLVFFLPLNI